MKYEKQSFWAAMRPVRRFFKIATDVYCLALIFGLIIGWAV